jgi:hypothetical protein
LKFKAKKFKEAEGLYKEALMNTSSIQNCNSEVIKLKKTLNVNIAVCTNNSKDWKESIEHLDAALEIDN